ncbi:2'-5' RNA ligase family protein [Streptomyces luteogriseus]|uniref:2'-5' RNA ligase family protein n=1 Tax=Streptomyces luteogriseus TaxID=68233 RepID=UPI0037B88795
MPPQLVIDNRSFPVAPPGDLNDASTIVANDWAAFAGIERMTSHWDRPGWAPGQSTYYWMLTFPDESELTAEASYCQRQLACPALDLVPSDGLHVTGVKIGSTDMVRAHQIDDLARRARSEIGSSFTMSVHPLAGSRGAVRFSITPWTPLIRLHAALSAIGHAVGVPGGTPTAAYRPHLGIAYNNRDRSAEPLIEQVSLLRGRPAITVRVGHVDLVELRRDGRVYRWDLLHRLPLEK